ncbi:MAG TPA: UDP-glucose 4-epimerase GalE, partial [Candidatus Saccharimonadales bacterium]|nr:UDP-glucose 4-epimerase GalE [Candidatus Saccharimonadales bacterium]
MKILVTGGAGYIGGIMTKRLLDDGHDVTVFDSIERGNESVVDDRAELVVENLCNRNFVRKFLEENTFDAVVHFAAYISMAESMQDPYIYFYNNVMGSLVLIEEMVKAGQNNLIFSSTAGVYGNPTIVPIPEDHEKNPTNPYGESKLMVERILEWYGKIYNFHSVALRYFNAAGATLDTSLGEQHEPETHIIPNVVRSILEEKSFTLFGTDYDTPDGTCVRDYIHVLDLAEAHVLAINKLESEPGQYVYNVGTGKGY